MITQCDLRFKGYLYTWERRATKKYLDRAFSNIEWRLIFDEIGVVHLPKFKSDHTSLLINFEQRRIANKKRSLFWFEPIWLTHPSFNQIVNDNLRSDMSNVPLQLCELQGVLQEWNKHTFLWQLRSIDKIVLDQNHSIVFWDFYLGTKLELGQNWEP